MNRMLIFSIVISTWLTGQKPSSVGKKPDIFIAQKTDIKKKDCLNRANYDLARWEVVDSLPAPSGELHMGLTEEGDYLWNFVNTTGSNPIFYKLRKSDGAIVRQFDFPGAGERYCLGLTMVNGSLYASEYHPTYGNVHVIDTLGNLIRAFNTGHDTRGLTWDGMYLWGTEADGQMVLQMDTIGSVQDSFANDGNIEWFMDIAFDERDNMIWADDDGVSLDMNKILTTSSPFIVMETYDHPSGASDYPEGITYSEESDGDYLYTCAAYSPWIWKIKIHDYDVSENPNADLPQFKFGSLSPSIIKDVVAVNFAISELQIIIIAVYATDGRLVKTLAKSSFPGGEYRIIWKADDEYGSKITSGVYFVQLEAGRHRAVRKVVVVR